MQMMKKAVAVLLVLSLMGCTSVQNNENIQEEKDIVASMEAEPEITYEVPYALPNILVNQLGYITGDTKVAIFCGKEMPEEFYVVQESTGKVVLTGLIEDNGYNTEAQEYNGYGDFSEICDPGSYYIEAPILGRSFTFEIGDGLYDDIFREACRQYYYNRCGMTLTGEYAGERAHNACHTGKALLRQDISVSLNVNGGWHQDENGTREVGPAAEAMAIMMLAYELYADAFTDDMGIPESGNGVPDILDEVKYEVEWLLKMQDEATGSVYAGVTVYEHGAAREGIAYVEPGDAQTAMAFAMALAKFSYLYQDFDTEYATVCLKAADRAWEYAALAGAEEDAETDGWRFAAAAELYRASGKQSCHKYVSGYLSREDYGEDMGEVVFLGSVAYISTRQPVKLELCEKITRVLMLQAEKISEDARNSVYLTEGNKAQDNNDELLLNMMYLSMIDHMITNHEYGNVIEDHLHYFLGRNKESISYIDGIGERNYESVDGSLGIMRQFDADSKLILMLSEIIGTKGQ